MKLKVLLLLMTPPVVTRTVLLVPPKMFQSPPLTWLSRPPLVTIKLLPLPCTVQVPTFDSWPPLTSITLPVAELLPTVRA